MWTTGWAMVQDHPILGLGLNTFMANYLTYVTGPNQGPAYAHNCFLQITAETGVIGLVSFLWFLLALFGCYLSPFKNRRGPKELANPWLTGLTAALLAFLVQSMFDTNLYSLRQAALFWTLAGIEICVSSGRRRRPPYLAFPPRSFSWP